MQDLWKAIKGLPPGRRAVIITMVAIIALTWIAVCAVMVSMLA
jgi:hypothetical protein